MAVTTNKAEKTKVVSFFLINVKAHHNQQPKHYIEAFKTLYEKNPKILLPRDKAITIDRLTYVDNKLTSKHIFIKLLYFTVVDPSKFYNLDRKENVTIEGWDPSNVANIKKAEMYFFPEFHMLVLKTNSPISLTPLTQYLREGLGQVAADEFDIDVVKSRKVIKDILSAHKLYKFDAVISFSNGSHTNDFEGLLDKKTMEMNPSRLVVSASGTKEQPLNKPAGGLAEAMIKMSEQNGSVRAVVQKQEGGKQETINTSKYPEVLKVAHTGETLAGNLYGAIKKFNANDEIPCLG